MVLWGSITLLLMVGTAISQGGTGRQPTAPTPAPKKTSPSKEGTPPVKTNRTNPSQSAKSTVVDLIVRGGTVVTMDGTRRVIENGGVAIKSGRIVAVDTTAAIDRDYSAQEIVDGTGKVVIPGLINGHTHVPMTLFRGLADDLDLQEWLTKYIFPAEAKNVTEDFVRVGTRLGLAEMIRSGTTTYCDMYYFEDAIADETSKAGM
ncbi:MAG: amidohydrolase family protein, partial [Acidobacteriota bacterium]